MAETLTIARPYAEALFRLADDTAALAAWSDTLTAMARVARNPEMQTLFGNPRISRGQLADLFIAACGDLQEEGRNLVHLMVTNGRLALVAQVAEQFEALKREREGVVEAQIFSAFPLDDAQKSALVADLGRRLNKRVDAVVALDPDLIGGVKIVVGDQVIDGSARARLAAMSNALKS
jgi:F-type H+-transporting ATPase subunit delta